MSRRPAFLVALVLIIGGLVFAAYAFFFSGDDRADNIRKDHACAEVVEFAATIEKDPAASQRHLENAIDELDALGEDELQAEAEALRDIGEAPSDQDLEPLKPLVAYCSG